MNATFTTVVTPHTPVVHAPAESSSPDPRHLLIRRIAASDTKPQALLAIQECLASIDSNAGMWFVPRDDAQNLASPVCLTPSASTRLPASGLASFRKASDAAAANGCPTWLPRGVDLADWVLIVPVLVRQSPPELLCLLPTDAEPGSIAWETLGLWFATCLANWHLLQQAGRMHRDSVGQRAWLQLVEKTMRSTQLRQAGQRLASGLCPLWGVDQVAIGLINRPGGACRLLALSGQTQFDRHSEFTRAIEHALDETTAQADVATWPALDVDDANAPLTYRRLAGLVGCQRVSGLSFITEDGATIGAALLLQTAEAAPPPHFAERVRAGRELLAGICFNIRAAHSNALVRLTRAWPQRFATRRVVAIVAAVVFALLCLPLPHRLSCSCVTEPVTRRFVAAPFAGTLQKTVVEPGDVVRAGDVLALLDDREIHWELTGVEAEYNRAKKKHDAALASRAGGPSQLAALEMQQLETKLETLKWRIANLTIKSPVHGVVVLGDLKRSEGVPLTVGQPLFEVAPLDAMIAEIAIPEADIQYAQVGQATSFTLDAFPGKTWRGVVRKIHPRAEERDSSAVFIAEVSLADGPAASGSTSEALRPGMKGQARIHVAYRPLGWLLFHRTWETARSYVGV